MVQKHLNCQFSKIKSKVLSKWSFSILANAIILLTLWICSASPQEKKRTKYQKSHHFWITNSSNKLNDSTYDSKRIKWHSKVLTCYASLNKMIIRKPPSLLKITIKAIRLEKNICLKNCFKRQILLISTESNIRWSVNLCEMFNKNTKENWRYN